MIREWNKNLQSVNFNSDIILQTLNNGYTQEGWITQNVILGGIILLCSETVTEGEHTHNTKRH
jgi:hypothetical protein